MTDKTVKVKLAKTVFVKSGRIEAGETEISAVDLTEIRAIEDKIDQMLVRETKATAKAK